MFLSGMMVLTLHADNGSALDRAVEREEGTYQIVPDELPPEYQSALAQARRYSEVACLSKARIYEQLSSDHWGRFDRDVAQYAVDNLEMDFYASALEKARMYQTVAGLSKPDIYEMLRSPDGGQFTAEEAQYAVDHLEEENNLRVTMFSHRREESLPELAL
jgi:hypothetical protein